MKGNAFTSLALTVGVMIIALWISMDIFASGGNALGKAYFYVMIASFLFGLFSPKKAFFYLLFQTGYIDYFKRLMILDSGVRMMDLYWVLGISPCTFGGIALGLIFQLGRSDKLRPGEGRIMVVSIVGTAALFGLAVMNRGVAGKGLGNILNAVMYIPCLFVIPRLFRTPGETAKLMRIMCYLYVPSAGYLIYQSYFGLTWWEHKYLQSGLSIEVRQYSEQVFRCMGTMAGAAGATIVYSMMAALLAFGGLWRWRDDGRRSESSAPFLRLLLVAFYLFGAWRTFSRTGWFLGAAALAAMVALPRRSLVLTFYTSVAVVYLSIMAASSYLLKNQTLNRLDNENRKQYSAEAQQAKQLSTLNGRLEGMHQLITRPQLWTPFGLRFSGASAALRASVHSHDFITDIILYYGYVTLIGGFIVAYRLLRAVHGQIFRMAASQERDVAVSGLGVVLGIALGGLSSGAIFSVFPQNIFVYLFFGCGISMMLLQIGAEKEVSDRAQEEFENSRLAELEARRGHRRQNAGSNARRRPALAV